MAKGDEICESEEVVRAAMYPYWDADQGRGTPSAFAATEVSVSRLAICDLEQIISIFKADFDGRVHPDGSSMDIRGFGQGRVASIISQAETPMQNSTELPNVVLTVNEDPISNETGVTNNPSHALICGWDRENPSQPRKISRGVAKRLLNIFSWNPLPPQAM